MRKAVVVAFAPSGAPASVGTPDLRNNAGTVGITLPKGHGIALVATEVVLGRTVGSTDAARIARHGTAVADTSIGTKEEIQKRHSEQTDADKKPPKSSSATTKSKKTKKSMSKSKKLSPKPKKSAPMPSKKSLKRSRKFVKRKGKSVSKQQPPRRRSLFRKPLTQWLLRPFLPLPWLS